MRPIGDLRSLLFDEIEESQNASIRPMAMRAMQVRAMPYSGGHCSPHLAPSARSSREPAAQSCAASGLAAMRPPEQRLAC